MGGRVGERRRKEMRIVKRRGGEGDGMTFFGSISFPHFLLFFGS